MVRTAHLTKNLERSFAILLKTFSHKMSGMPKFLIFRPMNESEKIFAEHQKNCQLGMSMLFYLEKCSRMNIANATRELSKVNNGVNPAAFRKLLCVIKYALESKN